MHRKFSRTCFDGIIVLSCILLSVRGKAQIDLKLMGRDGIPHNLEFKNADGSFLPMDNKSDIK